MKILQLVSRFRVGGLEQVICNIVTAKVQNLEHQVLVLKKGGPFSDFVQGQGVPVEVMENEKTALWLQAKHASKLAHQKGCFVAHCHDLHSWQVAVLSRTLFGGPPVVFTKHGHFEALSWPMRQQIKLLASRSAAIVAVSQEVLEELKGLLPGQQEKLKLICNGIDTQRFDVPLSKAEAKVRLGIAQDTFVSGTVARFHPVKNVELQIDMARELKAQGRQFRHLLIAPLTEPGKQLQAQVQAEGLQDELLFLGFREDIPELLRAMDVFVLSSLSEGTSVALLEALAAGVPAAASNVGGNPNLVSHGKNGFLFASGNAKELAEAVARLMDDPKLLSSQGEAAKQTASLFGIAGMMENYNRLYSRVAN